MSLEKQKMIAGEHYRPAVTMDITFISAKTFTLTSIA